MLINRECKTSIVRPSPDYINRVARYIPYRTKALKNLKEQLFPEGSEIKPIQSAFTSTSMDLKFTENVNSMMGTIKRYHAFSDTNRHCLLNPYTSEEASVDQSHDLLSFRSIGEKEYLFRIEYFILRTPSVKAPKRMKKLQTFSVKTIKLTQAEKDKKLIISAMMNKMQFSKKTGKPIEKPGEHQLELPMAISDHMGNPLKGQKSYSTKCLETRYKAANPPVFMTQLPSNWTPQCCLMEGMFIINTTPLGSHTTLADYTNFLTKRYILSEFHKGAIEVHIIFDTPPQGPDTPKYFEQKRRDQGAPVHAGHQCITLDEKTRIDSLKWRSNCRTCKRNLVIFLGGYLLHTIGQFLMPHQTLFVGGAFERNLVDTAWFVQGQDSPQPHPAFSCNAMETDTRLWLHAKNTRQNKILVISPDTNVYHIGLPLLCAKGKEVVVQLNEISNRQLEFLSLKSLQKALENDPDLSHIHLATLPRTIQTVYTATGCDYTSFFSKIGKATFFKYLIQYASFITGGQQPMPGTLSDSSNSLGFLAFMRLVGTV